MEILLSDNTVIDNVSHCYPATINNYLVIEIGADTMAQAMEVSNHFQQTTALAEITLQMDGRPSEVFCGYNAIAGMNYNFPERKLTLFLTK